MPFIEGESLRARLNREQQLPLHDAVRITREAAEALAYAHEHGVVHRDIKPENILLQNGHALVADFGIARAVDAAGEKLTQTGMAVGTPHYMSPEQSLGADHADGRSDIYSLGCVLTSCSPASRRSTGPTRGRSWPATPWSRSPASGSCGSRFRRSWKTRSSRRWRRRRPTGSRR